MSVANLMRRTDDVTVACYEGSIPSFVDAELERLYGHIYSSMPFFKQFSPLQAASTYVASKGGKPITVLLFRCAQKQIVVFNEMISLDETEIMRFANYIFAEFKAVSMIFFSSVQTTIQHLPFPFQQYNEKEDFIVMLPATQNEYMAQLGKSTRNTIKYYMNKVVRKYPSFICKFYENKNIQEQHIREILDLGRIRVKGKQRKFAVDDEAEKCMIKLAKICGFISVIFIDGRVCGGSINYAIKSNYFGFIKAYDQAYDKNRLGTLCSYLTICECIARGGKQFHMGWGREQYKHSLLGIRQDFDRLIVYRSCWQLVYQCDMAVRTIFNGYVRQLKLWLLVPKRKNSFISRCAINLLYIFRKLMERTKA